MTISTKPYLVRAIYEWCVDQGFTPYLAAVVDERTVVPPGTAREGQIVLNIGPDATHQLQMGNELITFQARFGGVAHALSIPVGNVVAVYARENGHGMAFEVEVPGEDHDAELERETESTPGEAPPAAESERPAAKPSHLKVIK